MSKEKPAGEVVAFPTPEGVKPEETTEVTQETVSEETSTEEKDSEEPVPFVDKIVTEEDANAVIEAIKANIGKGFLEFSLEVEKKISAIKPISHESRNIIAGVGLPEGKSDIADKMRTRLEEVFPGSDSAPHTGFIDAYEHCMSKRELAFFLRKADIERQRNPMESLLEMLGGK